MNEALELSMQD